MSCHPDRSAPTLARCATLAAAAGPFEPPGPGSLDARIDLKLLAYRAQQAMAGPEGEAAREHLAAFDPERRPDLWAGTVQDGVARGFLVALEEAISLAPEPAPRRAAVDPVRDRVFEGKGLRRKKDILVASGGSRIRYSRKGGVLFVDRATKAHNENCLRFEDRSDTGTLDGFAPAAGERPRIFNPAFLKADVLRQGPERDQLVLAGRLGRGPNGCACRMTFEGWKDEPFVRMTVRVENRHPDHRLRIRFLGFSDTSLLRHHCTPVWEKVQNDAGGFLAATIVRACGRLPVDGADLDVPGAQCPGWIEHRFDLGG